MVERNSHNPITQYICRLSKESDINLGTETASTLCIEQLCDHSSPKIYVACQKLHCKLYSIKYKIELELLKHH